MFNRIPVILLKMALSHLGMLSSRNILDMRCRLRFPVRFIMMPYTMSPLRGKLATRTIMAICHIYIYIYMSIGHHDASWIGQT
jgi:hypothetical protein